MAQAGAIALWVVSPLSSLPQQQVQSALHWARNPLFGLPGSTPSADNRSSPRAVSAATPALQHTGVATKHAVNMSALSSTNAINAIPKECYRALDAQQHAEFEEFASVIMAYASAVVDVGGRGTQTLALLNQIRLYIVKPGGRASIIWGDIVGTGEIQGDAAYADRGMFPEPSYQHDTIVAAVGHQTGCLSNVHWLRRMHDDVKCSLLALSIYVNQQPHADIDALSPEEAHALVFEGASRDSHRRHAHRSLAANPQADGYAAARDATPVPLAQELSPATHRDQADRPVQLEVNLGPVDADRRTMKESLQVMQGMLQLLTTQHEEKPHRSKPLELRLNSYSDSFSSVTAVVFKAVILLRSVMHPDPRSAVQAVFALKQGSRTAMAFLYTVVNFARLVRGSVSMADLYRVVVDGLSNEPLKAQLLVRMRGTSASQWSFKLMGQLIYECEQELRDEVYFQLQQQAAGVGTSKGSSSSKGDRGSKGDNNTTADDRLAAMRYATSVDVTSPLAYCLTHKNSRHSNAECKDPKDPRQIAVLQKAGLISTSAGINIDTSAATFKLPDANPPPPKSGKLQGKYPRPCPACLWPKGHSDGVCHVLQPPTDKFTPPNSTFERCPEAEQRLGNAREAMGWPRFPEGYVKWANRQ